MTLPFGSSKRKAPLILSDWQRVRESNPSFSLERAVSWPIDERAGVTGKLPNPVQSLKCKVQNQTERGQPRSADSFVRREAGNAPQPRADLAVRAPGRAPGRNQTGLAVFAFKPVNDILDLWSASENCAFASRAGWC